MFTSLPEHRRLSPLLAAVREHVPEQVQSRIQFFYRLLHDGTPTHFAESIRVCRTIPLWTEVIDELTRNPVTFHALHLDQAHSFCIENWGIGVVYVERVKSQDEPFNKWSNVCITLNLNELQHQIQEEVEAYHQSYEYISQETERRWCNAIAWVGMVATGMWWWLRA